MALPTQKQEAFQAARLLFDHALAGEHAPCTAAQIETLYRARQMLEAFIESAGVLESTGDISLHVEMIGGIRYAVNERVRFSKWHDETAQIVSILAQQNLILIRLSTGTVTPLYYGELMALNPEGSK